MVEPLADPRAARRRIGFDGKRRRASQSLAFVICVLAATGCGAGGQVTKAGARLVDPKVLLLRVSPANLPPGVGGDFTMTYQHGKTQFLPGDGFVIWNTLEGSSLQVIYCVVARQHPSSTYWCISTYVLPAGQIDAVGDYDNSVGDAGTVALVGGTGAYAGARGTVTTGDDDPYITIRLK
jgi:hypothetical protein